MKTKNISILLFILVFAGVALLGATQVWADDALCTQTEKDTLPAPSCFEADVNGDLVIDYVVKIYVDEETAAILGSTWPIVEDGTNNLIWRYKATVHGGITNRTECGKETTWNYFLLSVTNHSYVIGSSPPGAQIAVPKDLEKCGGTLAVPLNREAEKWNPSLNCGFAKDGTPNSVVFSLTTSPGIPIDACGTGWIVTNKNCTGDSIAAPDAAIPVQTNATYDNCGPSNSVEVTFNQCTGIVESVLCATGQAVLETGAVLCDTDTGDSSNCEQITWNSWIICTQPAPVYVQGGIQWWCPEP